jgi:hypothetical protein
MASNVSASVLNTLFTNSLDTAQGKEKLAVAGASYVRERLRETSFAAKILPMQQVTKADLQRSVSHEGFTKIVDVEPQSLAVALDFRSQPDGRFITAPRFEVPFFTISSERFHKTEQELQSYEMPITKVIEQNSVKDLQRIQDRTFIDYAYAAVLGASALPGGVNKNLNQGGQTNIQAKADLIELFDTLDDDELAVGTLLMTKSMFNSWLALPNTEIGSILNSEIAVDGYKYNTILGHKIITTIKRDIIFPTEIWCFADPDYLGKHYVLNNVKFYIDKRANMVEWQSWFDLGMGFPNIRSISRKWFGDADPRA